MPSDRDDGESIDDGRLLGVVPSPRGGEGWLRRTTTRRFLQGGPPSSAERIALGIAAAGMVGFGIYGFVTGAPSTIAYVSSVAILIGVISWFRRAPLPGVLAIALAVDAVVHLAGGLVQLGEGGLYNAGFGTRATDDDTRLLQYDHVAHTFGSLVGTVALWTLLAPSGLDRLRRRDVLVLSVLAGIGLGALNEAIEFLATLAHSGAHVGGYTNTGWDLIANLLGALAAGGIISRQQRHPNPPT